MHRTRLWKYFKKHRTFIILLKIFPFRQRLIKTKKKKKLTRALQYTITYPYFYPTDQFKIKFVNLSVLKFWKKSSLAKAHNWGHECKDKIIRGSSCCKIKQSKIHWDASREEDNFLGEDTLDTGNKNFPRNGK